MLMKVFSFLQEFKIRLNYVSRPSVRRKYKKIQNTRKSIFGNIIGSFWIQNRSNIGIYIAHTISNILDLALENKNETNRWAPNI